MKVFPNVRMALLLGVIGVLGLGRGNAQNVRLAIQVSPSSVEISNNVTYSFSLTNLGLGLSTLRLSNVFSAPIEVVNGEFSVVSAIATTNFSFTSNTAVFVFSPFNTGDFAQLALTVNPTSGGILTNTVTLSYPGTPFLPSSTNVLVTVTAPAGDIAVSITGPSQAIYVNDPVSYTLTVTNTGPSPATGVMLTNRFSPTSQKLLSTTQTPTQTGNPLVFSLGTIAGGSSRSIGVTVQPTNAGTLAVAADISGTGVDTNTADNTASINFFVSNFLPIGIRVTNLTTMRFDPQTSLMKQTIRATCLGSNTVAAPYLRVAVTNLPVGLFNAVGTNNGNPYVLYATSLAPGSYVDLGMEYFNPTRLPFTVPDSNYIPQVVSTAQVLAPVTNGTVGSFAITKSKRLTDGTFLIEFDSTTGAVYTVLYTTNVGFRSNVLAAQPFVTAQANRTLWIDTGPPRTISFPTSTNAPFRFYRVRQN